MSKTPVDESEVIRGLLAQMPIPTDATTSRTVVSNDAVRVVAFAMDAGQELTDHSAPRPVVVHVVAGDMSFTAAGETNQLSGGDVVYLAPNERHALQAVTACRFLLVMVTAT